jgi:hypothetical protein
MINAGKSILNIQAENIEKIMKQTNYTYDETREKLIKHNDDYMKVLNEYFGIPEKPVKLKSLNQEIYTQIRKTLDSSMSNYREQNPINIEQVITNINESEEREKEKKK